MNTPTASPSKQDILFDQLRHLLNDTTVSDATLLKEVEFAHSYIESGKTTLGVSQKFWAHLYVNADDSLKDDDVTKLAEIITTTRKNAVDELEEATRLKINDLA